MKRDAPGPAFEPDAERATLGSGDAREGARPDATPTAFERSSTAPRASWATVGVFLLLLVAGLAYAQAFLTPVLLAFFLALVFSPVRRTICRTGLPNGVVAALIAGGLAAVLLTVGYLLTAPVVGWVSEAPEIGARLAERVREIRSTIAPADGGEAMREAFEDVKEAAAPGTGEERTVVLAEPGPVGRLMALVPTVLVQSVFVLVLLLFLLASGDMFYEKIVHVMPRFRDKRRAVRTVRDVERRLSRYLFTITLINAGLGFATGLAMWAFGMPDPLLFGVIAWLFNYVPYVGAIGGTALVLVVGLLTFDGIWAAVLPAVTYYALTAIEGQFVTPYFVGRNLKLNTVVVFVSIAFCAWLWSIVGMLIAVPVLVTIRTICKAVPTLEPVADFLSARGEERSDVPAEDAPVETVAETSHGRTEGRSLPGDRR